MANIRSNAPINLSVNGTTVLSAENTGIVITGTIGSNNAIPSASYATYATTASYALNGGGSGTFASRFIIHNGEGSTTALTTGTKYTTSIIADKASTITGWKLFCEPSSSVTLDVLKSNKTKPSAANSITGSAAPAITNNQYTESTTLTGWTTSVVEGDILVLKVVSNTAASYIQLELTQQ